ncbi:hypothetical protein M406DRAFT_344428 [Cryphonectria parasitica EP155]|uniref:Uncharacterized protein n=1 Tax=Cryphonectria parasitica (strain ATCC 38755 / EP155) TaxID=660469 RepID=A0A9P4YDC9_CRYP1|nr:uncharacterized protein M406DRAFT_344428 [Cryphonectria parasitica EP155]KAF3770981.1 hypothetical protein M406DRAFT_344428 [Cryphonectria parasitica EP155]
MNTVGFPEPFPGHTAFRLGWGSLCVAGAGAYVVAKRSINADRQARLEEQRKKKSMIESLEYGSDVPSKPGSSSTMGGSVGPRNGGEPNMDPVGSPSREQCEPAPTRHAPTTEKERVLEKSKYESSTPFRSKKGDRFSDM